MTGAQDQLSLPCRTLTAAGSRRLADGGLTETVVRYPTRDQVEHALRQLDGNEVNDLYLRTSDTETYLGKCGGPKRYMVTLTEHADRFAQLLNPEDPSQVRHEIMCGGQLTRFARLFLHDLQTTLIAAVHYLANAQAEPTLSWEWY